LIARQILKFLSFFKKKEFFFRFNYILPAGRVDVFVVGARSPVCFVGKPEGFVVDGGGILPVLLA